MTDYRIVSGPATRTPDNDLSTARSRKFSFDLSGTASFGFSIDGRHDQALGILELATDVHAIREGTSFYTGRVGRTSDDLDGDSHTTEVATQDTRWLFGHRLVRTDRTYSGVDVGVFFRDMLIDAQAGTAGGLNITIPPTAPVTGVTMIRTSKAGATVQAELDAAAGGTEGGARVFDWDVAPGVGARTPQLWTPGRGRPVVDVLTFIYDTGLNTDPANDDHPYSSSVASLKRVLEPKDYSNSIRVIGGVKRVQVSVTTPNETPTTPVTQTVAGTRAVSTAAGTSSLTVVRGNRTVVQSGSSIVLHIGEGESTVDTSTTVTTTASTATNSKSETITIEIPTEPVTLSDGTTLWEVGPWATAESYTDIVEQAELVAKAASRIAELQQVAPSYQVVLKAGYWRGPEHIWLGDTVRVVTVSGRLLEDVTLRVTKVDVDLDDDGEETVTLTVGPPATHLLTYLLEQQRAIATMQRLWTP